MNVFEWPNLAFFVIFVAFLAIRGMYGRLAQREEKAISRVDLQERILLACLAVGNLIVPVVYLFTPLLNFADYDSPGWVCWLGAVLLVIGLWLFWRSHADLGLNWSISLQVRERHQLVNKGVYALIRHPMYASIWLWGIAQLLLLQNWLAGPGTLVPFGVLYFLRTPREERMMQDSLGDDYREYMRVTGRLFPRRGPKR